MGELLAEVQVGECDIRNMQLLSSVLANYGPEADRAKWNTQADLREYSLFGVEVLYNGLNSQSLPTFSTFKYALCVSFPAISEAPCGRVYLCWNDPVAEEPAEPATGEE
ncbi:hypothetical protein D3C80_1594650 [compost metagenome]